MLLASELAHFNQEPDVIELWESNLSFSFTVGILIALVLAAFLFLSMAPARTKGATMMSTPLTEEKPGDGIPRTGSSSLEE